MAISIVRATGLPPLEISLLFNGKILIKAGYQTLYLTDQEAMTLANVLRLTIESKLVLKQHK